MIKQLYCYAFCMFFSFITTSTLAQNSPEKWSLKDCIAYAYKNNLNLLRNQNNIQASKNTLKQSRYDRLPSVSGSVTWNNGYGRNIDYTNNSYTTKNSSNINYGINASVNLFSGFQKKHQIEKNKLDLQADLLDIETAKENLALNITSYYLNILYAQEQLQIAKDNLAISQKQEKRIKELVNAGKLPKGNLLEQQSQIAQKESGIIEAENRLTLAYLDLYQALDIPNEKAFAVAIPNEKEIDDVPLLKNYSENFEAIIAQRPSMKSYDYRIESAEKNVAIARAGYFPTLSLNANISSGYSNLLYDYKTDPATATLVKAGRKSFADQYDLNLSKSWSLSLNIPIFTKFQTRTNVSNANIQFEDVQLQRQIEKNRLYKELQTAYTNAVAAVKKYEAQRRTVASLEESFRYAEEKFQLGMLSNFDYNESLTNLTNARSNMVQAKYEYLFRTKILQFYSGEPLQF